MVFDKKDDVIKFCPHCGAKCNNKALELLIVDGPTRIVCGECSFRFVIKEESNWKSINL